ncbi:class I SAM-dependent methyltransferase [Phenylobacterium aquaticum]|uniref:class I SAM-dependent methyltransferase n=1 Tax=Phenylobacterium aquaticum TaxID=1763816 RepID=UPI001F5D5841|nr:class I SAM-dependent methyltransferase [Phenylobacterium aquaticum]MCI3134012.1 class I SAM-dependent methyltransferase [Phenylobacterium aquaticum]
MTPEDTLAPNRYGRLCAEVYDLDKPTGSLFDIAYYAARLRDLEGTILEAAVGTGRLMIPLLEAGIAIEGFDHSAEMLAICAARAQGRGLSPVLTQARFQDLALGRQFAAIIVPASSFMLLDRFDEALEALGRLYDHLEPGGRLLVDLPPMSAFDGQPPERSWTAANGDLLTLRSSRAETDVIGQRRVHHDRYERWRDGRLVETEIERFAYRLWGMEEFRFALAAAGFSDITVSANYRPGRQPKPGDQILNFEAVRSG